MTDAPRRPLIQPSQAERLRNLREFGLDEELLPLNLTPEERRAASSPLARDENWRNPDMETKPGVKTSEFWLSLLAGVAIAVLAFTVDHGLPAIAAQLPSMGTVGTILLVLVPVAKMGLGWLLQRLTSNYADNRTLAKAGDAAAAKG